MADATTRPQGAPDDAAAPGPLADAADPTTGRTLRGRPTAKVRGIASDRTRKAAVEAQLEGIELDLVDAVAAGNAGTLEGQARVAALEARAWTLRSLVVTGVHERLRCAEAADKARTSLVRLEKAQTAARAKQLVEAVRAQQGQAARLVGLRRGRSGAA